MSGEPGIGSRERVAANGERCPIFRCRRPGERRTQCRFFRLSGKGRDSGVRRNDKKLVAGFGDVGAEEEVEVEGAVVEVDGDLVEVGEELHGGVL